MKLYYIQTLNVYKKICKKKITNNQMQKKILHFNLQLHKIN